MAAHRRRFAVLGILFLVAFIAGGQIAPPDRVFAQGGEGFLDVNPARLYAGVPSHAGPAEATGAVGLNGYCIDVQGETHRGIGSNFGFRVNPEAGVIVSADFDNNGSVTTDDDVYCVVVRALERTPSPTDLAGDPYTPNPPLIISWDYEDTATGQIYTAETAPIPVTEVRLVGFDGVIGGRALVCTEGWDATFLTGATSNAGEFMNPLDDVVLADWEVQTAGVTSLGQPFLNTTDFTTVNPADANAPLPRSEWCLSLTSAAAVADIAVALDFVAVFDRYEMTDDLEVEVHTGGAGIGISVPTAPELRHATRDGYLVEAPLAAPNAIYSQHDVCVLATDAGDTLDSVSGIEGGVSRYHDADPDNGIPDGTLCFSWSRTTPGREIISATVSGQPANWDTDGSGNGYSRGGELLVKDWYFATHTVISTGNSPDEGDVTNGSVDLGVVFNVGTGGFFGELPLNEWVFGVREPGSDQAALLDGVRVVITLEGCGHLRGEGVPVGATTIDALTIAGRYPFMYDVAEAGAAQGCFPGQQAKITIDTFYANGRPTGAEPETLTINVGGGEHPFNPGETAPTLAWAGDTVTIVYGFAASDCRGMVATFTRSEGQPGTFVLSGNAIPNGADSVIVPFDEDDCSATIGYESEDQGEVDIIATFEDNVDPVIPGDFSQVHFPLFFMLFEDVYANANSELIVSEQGLLEAEVRGWFLGSNPSGREREVKPDGRVLPQDRWVLPDDWEQLRGPGDMRSWPGSADMPPAQISFYMENEGVVNSFRTGEKRGAVGFFVGDGDGGEYSPNVEPNTNRPSNLGSDARPRIISEMTDGSGWADTGIFGDFNLSFEKCAKNAITGNPHCDVGDVVGRTRYYAVAEYPGWRGKHPPIASDFVETVYTWAGYKRLSVVDTEDPGIKYVVAHLKDRDGFCNAIGLHNVLGNQLRFEIDAGSGIILNAADEPTSLNINRRFATATTFDTMDDLGEPMNEAIAQPVLAEDECQAWVRISNSLLTKTNVMVTFPALPPPLPSEVRITNLVCGPLGTVTVTNLGDQPASLAGFGIRSARDARVEEHLGLHGFLEPGASATFVGDPALAPWVDASNDAVFSGAGDYARLVWHEFEVSRMTCGGESTNRPLPASYPIDTEGEIVLDLTVQFGQAAGESLAMGWNLISAPTSGSIESVLGANAEKVSAIYAWDAETGVWLRYIGEAPTVVNNLDTLEAGRAYWIEVKQPFTLRMTR